MPIDLSPLFIGIRFIPVRNIDVNPIPAFGLVRLAGVDGDGTIQVSTPNADSQTYLHVASEDIPASVCGQVYRTWPATVLYNENDGTPAAGETWGVKSGDYLLRKGQTGFLIVGGAASGLVVVRENAPGDAATYNGPVVFSSTVEYTSTSVTTHDSGSTDTYNAGATIVHAGDSISYTQNTTETISGGKTLTFSGGTVDFSLTAVTGLVISAAELPGLTGDVTASAGSIATTVVKIQGRSVAATAPTDAYVLTWVAADNMWEPKVSASGTDATHTATQIVYGAGIGTPDASSSLLTFATVASHGLTTLSGTATAGSTDYPSYAVYSSRAVVANLQAGDFVGSFEGIGRINGTDTLLADIVFEYPGNGVTQSGKIHLRTTDSAVPADMLVLDRSSIGVFGVTPAVRQTSGANLTNNVASGGTTDQVDNWTDLNVYATDAAAIRNAIYQLSRKLKQINDGMRAYGWFT